MTKIKISNVWNGIVFVENRSYYCYTFVMCLTILSFKMKCYNFMQLNLLNCTCYVLLIYLLELLYK